MRAGIGCPRLLNSITLITSPELCNAGGQVLRSDVRPLDNPRDRSLKLSIVHRGTLHITGLHGVVPLVAALAAASQFHWKSRRVALQTLCRGSDLVAKELLNADLAASATAEVPRPEIL